MKEYTYYFADGTKNTIEIAEEWCDILKKMDKSERKARYNYNRHNSPMSGFEFDGDHFADPHGDNFNALVRKAEKKKFDAVMDKLTKKQQELIYLRFNEMFEVGAIAEQEGVCISAISHRLERIQKKLEKLLA